MLGVRRSVVSTLGMRHVEKCLAEVDTSGAVFWSLRPWHTLARDSVLLALYKDTSGKSFSAILAEIKGEHHIAQKTLTHNVRQARKVLGQWATGVILPHVTTRQLSRISPVAKLLAVGCRKVGCVFIDSVDFKRIRQSHVGPKQDADWSYKEQSPAQRYLVISDSNERVLRVEGPYSPKVHQLTSLHTPHNSCPDLRRAPAPLLQGVY